MIFWLQKKCILGRHYIKKEKWIPAINRFKTVIEDYETTFMLKKLFIDC